MNNVLSQGLGIVNQDAKQHQPREYFRMDLESNRKQGIPGWCPRD